MYNQRVGQLVGEFLGFGVRFLELAFHGVMVSA